MNAPVLRFDDDAGDSVPVAAVSSATADDTAGTSFAGMNQMLANVTGEEELAARPTKGAFG